MVYLLNDSELKGKGKSVKFLAFSDYHYSPERYPQDEKGLSEIIEKAHKNNVDFIISCGDLCHSGDIDKKITDMYFDNKYGIPAYSCWGNHEVEQIKSYEGLLSAYRMEKDYFCFDKNGFRFIVLNTEYYKNEEGKYVYHRIGTTGENGGDCLGKEQLEWLEETIEHSKYPCILFSHSTFEKTFDNSSPDAVNVQRIIQKFSKKKSRVIMCCNGHYHRNAISVSDNVVWFDINATYNLEWRLDVHDVFPKEMYEKGNQVKHTCFSKDPLCAIVEIYENGYINIDGMKSEFLYGVYPQKLGWSGVGHYGRMCEAEISSARIRLDI